MYWLWQEAATGAASAEEGILTGWILFKFVLAALACYRLARLVAYDDIFGFLHKSMKPESTLGRFFSCPYCLGIWFTLILAPLVILNTQWALLALLILGIAGAQDLLESSTGSERDAG